VRVFYDWGNTVNEYERRYAQTHTEVKTFHFRGHSFVARVVPKPENHPTSFCFEDESEIREAWWHVEKGEVIFDVGASYGPYTLTALASGAKHVYAWAPEETRPLSHNVWENWFEERCTVFEGGLWSRRGILALRDGDNPVILCQTREDAMKIVDAHEGIGTTFEVRALDAITPSLKLDRLDWLKLDVEGAEVECLKGAIQTIATFRPKILIENHEFKDPNIREKCASLLRELRYSHVETRPHHCVSHSLYKP
jgi:FkbM family methyltransferase